MASVLKFSIIVPVHDRPDEVDELLASLCQQTDKGFEVLVVEDDAALPSAEVCRKYAKDLALTYYTVPGTGRSERRNFGMEHATGDWFIICDSDVIVPPQYIATVRAALTGSDIDCYGGPDSADSSFSDVQKAVNYSMTSIMTTGGIRGATKKKESFYPRTFNMGLSRRCHAAVGGFRNMISEDIDFSLRIREAGFKTMLIPEAYVYHKRRVSLKKFFRQVNTFGKGRVLLSTLHPGSLKPVHLLPAAFVLGHIALVAAAVGLAFVDYRWALLCLLPIGIYVLGLFTESLIKNKSLKIAFMSIATAYIQLFGYGLGFIDELLTRRASKANQEELYKRT